MQGGVDALWTAAAAAAVSVLALAFVDRASPAPRGWTLWLAAGSLTSLGLAVAAAFGANPWGSVAAQLLMLPAPLLAVAGMRRFHARVDWPGRPVHDLWMLGSCAGVLLLGAAWPGDSPLGAVLVPVATLLAHLYAAAMLVCAGTRPDARPMHLLGALLALGACAPMLAALPHLGPAQQMTLLGTSTALTQVAMAFILVTLRFDRSERHLRASRRRLRELASIDPLTQVPNRRHFEELAGRALSHDPPASAVLMMFDLDHFKHINDQLGHAGGDRALRLVARCVREILRVQDIASRHGGDEFALLLRHASVADAMRVASRLVSRVQFLSSGAGLPTLSLSFGVVQVRPAEPLAQALQRADKALYEAKRQGRSRAVAANATDHGAAFGESRPLGLTSA